MRERPILDQLLEVAAVHAVLDGAGEARAYFGEIAIAYGFDEQIAQGPALELELA